MSYKYIYYYILNSIKDLYTIKKNNIKIETSTYFSEVLEIEIKNNKLISIDKIYNLELKFDKLIYYFNKFNYKINLSKIKKVNNSEFNLFFIKKNELDIDFSQFCLNNIINDDIYGINEEMIVNIGCEIIEFDWIKYYKIKKWEDLLNFFVDKIDKRLIPYSNYEPIYITVIHWTHYIKVICVMNIKGYYLLELFRE